MSLTKVAQSGMGTSVKSASSDLRVFYFGVLDEHDSNECSGFLREELHTYIGDTARQSGLQSSLKGEGVDLHACGQQIAANDNQSSSSTKTFSIQQKSERVKSEELR